MSPSLKKEAVARSAGGHRSGSTLRCSALLLPDAVNVNRHALVAAEHMQGEALFGNISVWAEGARIGQLANVGSHVAEQGAVPAEGLGAQPALVRLLTRVCALVTAHVSFLGEPLGAVLALEGSIRNVLAQPLQVACLVQQPCLLHLLVAHGHGEP